MTRAKQRSFLSPHDVGAHMPALAARVNQVPHVPGCYLWKDREGRIVYVGKAKDLHARMHQYVSLQDERAKIPLMMRVVRDFEYVVVDSEHDALVLERNLIAEHKPYFNVDFKDDKSYPYIAITESEIFPAIKYTRERHKKGTRYFGPYTDARSARATIDTLRKVIPLCSASCTQWKRLRRVLAQDPRGASHAQELAKTHCHACFDYHVHRGPGVCAGTIDTVSYARNVQQVERFLEGQRSDVISELTHFMHEAAADLDFEKAARIKTRLDQITSLQIKQDVTFSSKLNADFIGIYQEETISCVCVFIVREGIVTRTVECMLNKGLDVSEEELVAGFVKRYYEETSDIPHEIDTTIALNDAELIATWLCEKTTHRVYIHAPQRGNKYHLLETACQNARHALVRYIVKTGYQDQRINQALLELESALALERPPVRIECFDISTLHGCFTVASMVVFTHGKVDSSQYRRFKIKTPLTEANDFASMAEVFERRFHPERLADERFGRLPDLLVVDGGKAQMDIAVNVLTERGLNVPVCGLAKADEEIFVTWDTTPVVLPNGSASLYLIKHIRDESHRVAINFHRDLRAKAMTISILDEVPGIGPKRKKLLIKAFKSFKQLSTASEEEIAAVSGISKEQAHDVFVMLHQQYDHHTHE